MKKRLTFEIDDKLHHEFKVKCSKEHTSMGRILNKAVLAYLNETQDNVTVTDTMTVDLQAPAERESWIKKILKR